MTNDESRMPNQTDRGCAYKSTGIGQLECSRVRKNVDGGGWITRLDPCPSPYPLHVPVPALTRRATQSANAITYANELPSVRAYKLFSPS
jgi:hypothetical protein